MMKNSLASRSNTTEEYHSLITFMFQLRTLEHRYRISIMNVLSLRVVRVCNITRIAHSGIIIPREYHSNHKIINCGYQRSTTQVRAEWHESRMRSP